MFLTKSCIFYYPQVARGLTEFNVLFALMRVVWSLLQNPHIRVEPYVSVLLIHAVSVIVDKYKVIIKACILVRAYHAFDEKSCLIAVFCSSEKHDVVVAKPFMLRFTDLDI